MKKMKREKQMKMNAIFLILGLLLTAVPAYSQTTDPEGFLDIFKNLKTIDNQPFKCDYENDEVQKRILFEYGAVYVSKEAILPEKCRLLNQNEVVNFASKFKKQENKLTELGNFYLQPKAKESLLTVFSEVGGYILVARNWNGTTTHSESLKRDLNDDWAQRTFFQTKCNWLGLGKEKDLKACKRAALGVIRADNINIKSKPKMLSVAIPGASQHHLGLAIDVNDKTGGNGLICGDACVEALEKNGWFRTVRYDRFHYTYLGYKKNELQSLGLKQVKCRDTFTYWVPNVQEYEGYTNWRCQNVE